MSRIYRWLRMRLLELRLRRKHPDKRVSIQREPDAYRDWLEKTYGKEDLLD